jgi:hypothetical protein
MADSCGRPWGVFIDDDTAILVVRGDFGGGSFELDFNTFGFSDLGFFTSLLDSFTTRPLEIAP